MTDATGHPDVQTMTAFIDGKLAPGQIAEVAAHLRGCGECRTIVTETARLERETQAASASRTPWRWLAVAAVVAVVVAVSAWQSVRRRDPMQQLIAAADQEHRFVEARLAGFRWARLQASRGRGVPDPVEMKLIGVAGAVLEQTAEARTAEALRARGVAYLLSGRREESVVSLQQAAQQGGGARIWNDLAAARLALAEQQPSQLPLALADADRALRLDPSLAEAHFNRALILEELKLRDQARKEWRRYLEIEPDGEWSAEAHGHLRALQGNAQRRDPRSVPPRVRGEGTLMAQWAKAYAAGDEAHASEALSSIRAIAATLAAEKDEHMLADAVAAIDHADPTQRATLAKAFLTYADGRLQYKARNAGAAEVLFVRAADLFRRGGSPMAGIADYYAASAAFDQHRGAEARESLTRLFAAIDRRHRALAAQIQWQLGVIANTTGDYKTAVRSADASAAAFRQLGENLNVDFVSSIAAHALDMLGAGDAAWSRRIRIFDGLADDRTKLAAVLHSSAMTLAAFGHDDAAASLIDLFAGEIRDDPAQLATVLATRTKLSIRNGDAEAGAHAAAARAAVNRVADAALRDTVGAELDLADAALQRVRDPRAALAALDSSIAVFSSGHLGYLLPQAYLERARSFAAAGDDASAVADYEAGIAEVEKQRQSIDDADLRLRFLDVGAQLIDGLVDLQLSRGNAAAAFAAADRPRSPVESPSATPPRVGHGAAVIEYAVLPRSIAIFCLTEEGVSAKRVDIDRAALFSRIDSFTGKMRRRAPVAELDEDGAAIYRLLLAPLQPRLASFRDIVIVPDRELHAVPFAALYDDARHEYLVQQATIRLAPAAAGPMAQLSGALTPALVVADPPSEEPQLRQSRSEAAQIAAAYGATLLAGAEATRARFREAAKGSALIHFAGHAESGTGDSYAALLLAAAGDDPGTLGGEEIAKLGLAQRPLVVLAACGTIRGSVAHVAGMSSLARAFLTAGARGVVGTLWEIDDDTAAPLFLRIHEFLRAGESPARAVRAAQLEMIHASDARLRHPATWAPVELIGNVF